MPAFYKTLHTIADIPARGADRAAEKDAFRFAGNGLSYGDWVSQSRKLTTALLEQGVRRGDRVGVFLHQSLDIPIAIYGVLGAGAGFVPIDPMAPPARVRQIVEKCGIRHVVSQDQKADVLSDLVSGGLKLDCVIGTKPDGVFSLDWSEVRSGPETAPIRLNELDLAYIMFTSGSTGDPKGMVHTHANGLIYADNLSRYHDLGETDRFLNLSPLHFDMAVMDHVAAPALGGTTVIVSEAEARLPASLTALAAREKVSVWYSVPFVMIEMLLKGGMEAHDLTTLRWMIYGGEAFPLKHLRALMAALPGARFSNAYGPAETHQISSYDIDELPEDESAAIPIGKPWLTVDPLILDDDDNPVDTGEPGELLVRTPSCMRGYWRDPERTAAAFHSRAVDGSITDVFYRTGDIVSMDADGLMHFHGRKDRQIKLRGNRVELDEVEAALLEQDAVDECAVIKSADGRRLIATVRLADGAAYDRAGLIADCRAVLPAYAVPSDIIEVRDYPRTSSMKIDRATLAKEIAVAGQEGGR